MEFSFKIEPSPERVASTMSKKILGSRRAGMINTVTGIENLAVKKAPVKTSNLANARTTEVNSDGSKGIIRFTSKYAEFVHEGTGLYGPHRTKIIPKGKKALYWPGAAHPWKSVKGMKGRPFLANAAAESNPAELYKEGMERFLSGGAQ